MSNAKRLSIDADEFRRIVVDAQPPRREDRSPLRPGETLADRLFTMCGHEPPTAEQIRKFKESSDQQSA